MRARVKARVRARVRVRVKVRVRVRARVRLVLPPQGASGSWRRGAATARRLWRPRPHPSWPPSRRPGEG